MRMNAINHKRDNRPLLRYIPPVNRNTPHLSQTFFKQIRTDFNYAWPGAEIAVMGAEGAVDIIYRRELKAAGKDREKVRREHIERYREKFASPYVAAERGYVDSVIEPSDTRSRVCGALRLLRTKTDLLPPKKHGNIPL